ncbi:MAG: SpoIIE family protein phosphatase [Bacteroidales bacterium]|nr:SpoIIE family protein phosphatase [Bacteroidales bacterium]
MGMVLRVDRFRRVPVRGGLILLLVLAGSAGYTQHYFFDRFSVSEGLAQSTVYCILQDENDIVWMGTQAGVTRYDGSTFLNFSADDGLAENGVRGMCEDASGHLWFGHDGGGVTRYNGISFTVIPGTAPYLTSDITSIIMDSLQRIWITSIASGALMIENPGAPADELIVRHYSGNELSDRVFSGYVDPGGKLYFVADPNEKIYDPDSLRFRNLTLNGVPRYYMTTCMLVDRKGHTWIGKHNGGIYHYIPGKDTTIMIDLIKSGLSSNWVSTLYEDCSGNIWAGTWGGGAARLDSSGNITTFDDTNGLPGTKIWRIFQDREGNILLGTNEHGLCVFKGDHFMSYGEAEGLLNMQVWSILESRKGDYWIGTNEGIYILEHGRAGFSNYSRLRGERIRFLREDRKGRVWIGTERQGVFTVEPDGRFEYNPVINRYIINGMVTAMDIDGENNLWIGTLDGLIYYEIENRAVSRLTQTQGLAGNEISSVFADSGNRIWVGSDRKGVTVITGSEFRRVELDFDFSPTCFEEDRQQKIWVGTEGRGVLLIDPEKGALINTLSVRDGLLANLINTIDCDDHNHLYVGTNKGLNKYVPSENRIYSYTRRSGFRGIETKPNASLVDSRGNIWFGTVSGITIYFPERDNRKTGEPVTHITGLSVNYEPFPLGEGNNLTYKQNSLIFDYRCITFNPGEVVYQIKMEGVDPDWRPPDYQTSVNYPALRPGKYTFMVKARNSEGIWNSEPVAYSFVINPPFYLRYWFIISCILVLGLLVFTYVKLRERALVRENRILEEKVRDRTAVVVAQKEELSQKNKDITDSIRYAKRIQLAILPPELPFEETFILFKPKDIVSGDFYWLTEFEGKEFISAVDCTGHGVPGAFMSIIGHNSLNKIVREYGIVEPGQILTRLHREVIATLHQRTDAGDVYDGMDLALVCYDPKTRVLDYAGAFNPLYLIRSGSLKEIVAEKVSIGRSSVDTQISFTNHSIPIQQGDVIYIFSDGYADQFGGEKMKKFKYGNMKELFLRIHHKEMDEQKAILNSTIEAWRGDIAQVDDMLVIGRRFN